MAAGEKLRKIKSLPEWAQPAFEGMSTLNRIQSRVCECALFTANNMLVCAPTGGGKTNVAMLAVLHELGKHRRADGTLDVSGFKIVYVAPMKALVAEMVGNFTARLEAAYGVQVRPRSQGLDSGAVARGWGGATVRGWERAQEGEANGGQSSRGLWWEVHSFAAARACWRAHARKRVNPQSPCPLRCAS